MKQFLATLALLCCAISGTSADTLFVSVGGTGSGSSWSDAFGRPEQALARATAGDEIWISNGFYIETPSSLIIPNGVRMYGGFLTSHTLREQRDWFRNETVISGVNITVLLTLRDCDSTTRIDGFIFTNASQSAMVVEGGEPRIFNCQFRENNSVTPGAALYAEHVGRIRIEYCVFLQNTSAAGSPVHLQSDSTNAKKFGPFLGQCHFVNNRGAEGGAISFQNCAGISQVTSTVFAGNRATVGGGAMVIDTSWVYLSNCTFSNNDLADGATGTGRSVLCRSGAYIQNSVFWNGTEIGDIPHIKHVVAEGDTSKMSTRSCLVEGDFDLGFWQSDPVFENAASVNGPDGFYGTDDDGLALSSFSPVRDAGVIDMFVNHRQHDIIGNPRLVGRKIDLGAYESQRAARPLPQDLMAEMKTGKIVLMFRHGKTDWDQKDPGPSPECFPGRNLIAEGREQCTEIGAYQRMLGLTQGDSYSSPVCRCWETLDKMVGRHEKKQHWASGGGDANTNARLNDLESIPTNGMRIISTHDAVANLVFNPSGDGTILTTAELMEGDCLIVRPLGDTMEVIGQWSSENWSRYKLRFPGEIPSSVSETETRNANIRITPVPASEHVRILSDRAATAVVVDMLGRTIATVAVGPTASFVSVSGWTPGVYQCIVDGASARIVVAR